MISRLQEYTKVPFLQSSTWSPSTTTALSIFCVVSISTWRHYDTNVHRNPFQQEVWIEWLSWVLIFAFHKLTGPLDGTASSASHRGSFWTSQYALWLAGAVAVASQLLSSQRNLTWALPLTTLAVTLQAHYLSRRQPDSESGDKEEQSGFLSATSLDHSGDDNSKEQLKLPVTIGLNLVCFVMFLNYKEILTNKMAVVESLLFLLARSAAITCMSRLQNPLQDETESDTTNTLDARRHLGRLSVPMLVFLTLILVLVRPDLEMSSIGIISHAVVQAVWWTAMITLVRQQLVNTSANLDTVGLGAQLALNGTDITSVLMALSAFLVSSLQSVVVLRPGTAARRLIFSIMAVFVLVLWIHEDPRITGSLNTATPKGQFLHGHPIESLIMEKRAHFSKMLERQSKTLDQAVREYKRRYGRNPPAGFDKWFELAQQNDFILVDEFDTFMQSLEPFHGIHPSVVQQRIDSVINSPDEIGRMNVVKYQNRNVTISDNGGDVGMRLANTTWAKIVPYNVTILLNYWDEPMVNSPWDEVAKAITDARDPDSERFHQSVKQSHKTFFVEAGKQNGWAATRQACSSYSPSRQNHCPATSFRSPLQFIANTSYSMDVCQNCEMRQEHALLVNPGNMRLAHELTPIWSASKPSHFNDILYPSAYYIGVKGDYRLRRDSPWSEKDNKFYWVGRATGGWATKDTWDKFQRARFVLKTSPNNTDPIQLLDEDTPGSNKWVPRYTTMAEVRDLFATRMAGVVQCPEDVCEIERQAFDIRPDRQPDEQDAAYSHKFVVDLDGNGFSGRYYRLLESRSVVIKSTILKEWHDDFLIPWVHYVPLSIGYHELPEMARFLASTDRGLELSERIASESTEWHNKALRDVDLQLVYLRMVLEFGRVLQPDLTY